MNNISGFYSKLYKNSLASHWLIDILKTFKNNYSTSHALQVSIYI